MFISFSDALFSSLLLCSDVLTACGSTFIVWCVKKRTVSCFCCFGWLQTAVATTTTEKAVSLLLFLSHYSYFILLIATLLTQSSTRREHHSHSCYQPTKHLHSRSLSTWSHRLLQTLVFCCFMLCCHMNKSCQIFSVIALN